MTLLGKMPRSPARSAVMAAAPDLERDAVVVCWLSCRGDAVSLSTASAPAAQATTWTRLGEPCTLQLPSTVMIIVRAAA